MDEFGSPLAGGIKAVRRNLSSSFFGAPRQANPDPVTTNLLQQQSLQLTSVSGQLENISRQVTSLDFSLKGVKENLALNEQLERQREGAKQNRERILAEQGLREGKESALENKIQQSLTQPLQRIGIKTQNTLGNVTQFLLTLAGGWLTITGIDLLAALSEGNVDKINKLKTRFLTGLTVIAGTMTAISLGIKKTLGILGTFSFRLAQVAFGGLLKGSLKGVQILLAGLVKKAAVLGSGLLAGGGLGAFIKEIVGNIIAFRILGAGGNKAKNIAKPFLKKLPNVIKKPFGILKPAVGVNAPKVTSAADDVAKVTGSKTGNFFLNQGRKIKKFFVGTKNTVGAMSNPVTTGGLVGKTKGLLTKGKNIVGAGVKNIKGSGTGLLGKLGRLTKGLPKLGVGRLLGKVFGPLITFFAELTSEDGGLVSALSAVGGFLAGAKIGAALGGLVGSIVPGAGTAVGAFIGGLIGGIIGEELIKRLSKKIMSALGFKDIKVFGNKDKKNEEVEAEGKFTGGEVLEGQPYKVGERGAELFVPFTDGEIIPIKSNLSNAASQIGDIDDAPEIITVPMGGSGGQTQMSTPPPAEKASSTLPVINFDTSNPHTLYATSVTGAGI